MPKANRVCSAPDCHAITSTSRCQEHQREYQRTTRGNWRRNRYGAAWPRIRKRILTNEPNCRLCGNPATDVDHIVPYAYFATRQAANALANLQPLCTRCHGQKTRAEVQSREAEKHEYQPTEAETNATRSAKGRGTP